MALSKDLRASLIGTPFGEVRPDRLDLPLNEVDGRTVALRLLARYFSEVVFRRPGGVDERTGKPEAPIAFQIPYSNIHIEQPDYTEDLTFPALAFISTGPANYDAIGLVAYVDESTRDRYGRGTVLQVQSEYQENFVIEIWANKRAERRALLSGLEVVLTPTEQRAGLRMLMADYYDQNVCFMLLTREVMDDADSSRGRRRARLTVEMRFNVVVPVNYTQLQPEVLVQVDADALTGEAIELDPQGPTVTVDPSLPGEPAGGCCND